MVHAVSIIGVTILNRLYEIQDGRYETFCELANMMLFASPVQLIVTLFFMRKLGRVGLAILLWYVIATVWLGYGFWLATKHGFSH